MDKQKQNMIDFLKIHKTSLWLSLFFLLGMGIRLYNLGSHNLWFDELWSYRYSRALSLINTFDYNPPLYFALLSILVKCFGSSEFALRSLSMIFGMLSILLIYRLGNLLFDKKTGLASAFILSISPMHIWYSQEARGYSLSVFLVMLIVYTFILALQRNNGYLWAGFIVSSIFALYTNYFSFFIIILVGILFLSKSYRLLLRHYLLSLCIISVAMLPLIPIFFQQISSLQSGFWWIPKPRFTSIVITFENFNVGYNATRFISSFTLMVFSLLFIFGIWRWWQEKRKELLSLILFLFLPIIFTFLISQRKPVYLDRQLMLFSPFYYLIVAGGLVKINTHIIKIVAYLSIIAPILICLNNYFSYNMPLPAIHHVGVHVKKPVKPAGDYINSRFKEGDLVAYSDMSIRQITYYIPDIPKKQVNYFIIESKLKYTKFLFEQLEKFAYFQLLREQDVYTWNLEEKSSIPGVKLIKQLNYKRVWLVSSSWPRDGKLAPHVKAVRQFMRDHYSLLDSIEFDGIFVDLYCKKDDPVVK